MKDKRELLLERIEEFEEVHSTSSCYLYVEKYKVFINYNFIADILKNKKMVFVNNGSGSKKDFKIYDILTNEQFVDLLGLIVTYDSFIESIDKPHIKNNYVFSSKEECIELLEMAKD